MTREAREDRHAGFGLPVSGRGYRISHAELQAAQSCESGPCEKGKKPCPSREACRLATAEARRGYFSDNKMANRALWMALTFVIALGLVVLAYLKFRGHKP